MKLRSQLGGFEPSPPRSLISRRLRSHARRIPWGHVLWVLLALSTLAICVYAVSLLANTMKHLTAAA